MSVPPVVRFDVLTVGEYSCLVVLAIGLKIHPFKHYYITKISCLSFFS